MASTLSQVEDQTDEDFFDKLVDDEFGITESLGIESENAKAFSNLSIKDVDTILEDSRSTVPFSDAPEKDILVAEESISLSSIDSATGRDAASDTTSSKSAGSRSTSVKEVQWSSFNADSDQKGTGEFGWYSDLFPELPNSSFDQFEAAGSDTKASTIGNTVTDLTTSFNSSDGQEDQTYGQEDQTYEAVSSKTTDGQDSNGIQYWENLYPGWKYDPNTGEWHQLDGQGAMENTQLGFQDNAQSAGEGFISEQRSEASYLQQTAQTIVGTVSEVCITSSVTNLNEVSQENTVYPPNMVFDPQYPGWYYDTDSQEWRLLETYNQAVQTTSMVHDQHRLGENASLADKSSSVYGEFGQFENYNSQNQVDQDQGADWAGSAINYSQQNALQSGLVAKREDVSRLAGSQQTGNLYGSMGHVKNYADQQMGFNTMETVSLYPQANFGYNSNSGVTGIQSFVSSENPYQFNQPKVEQHQQTSFSHNHYVNQNSINYSQQLFQTGNSSYSQFSHVPNGGRSSAGRPPHALVTFGFGGKLVVMKDSNLFSKNAAYESLDPVGRSISILNLMEVVMEKIESTDASSIASGAFEYFRTLCQQSFPGPLVGGNAAMKELNKWIDERITNCESLNLDFRKGELLKLLLSLLKISCQHYGKLRSPFGVDPTLQETDGPESAVTKLFASAKRNDAQMNEYGAVTHCIQNLPSEGHLQATAVEVQNLLVSGRRKEALQCAREGQLWGPALVLAAQLGEKFYVDTVKQMAHYQFVSGSPLRTLCLLIAGQPADVFSPDNSINGNPSGAVISEQPMQVRTNAMLDDWETNLAMITANRTKDDELVIVHLGDCLWKERSEIIAAHTCYLVAEANFESYSETARMCLLGADHWKCPRTYASPEAIQRTEFYEYSKVLGNSQFILLPFQPYKLIYAYMLAEVGRVSDSLRYCQAILKSLKNSGRATDVESWKLLISSLEERIRTHQQGGYVANLAPTKLVGKFFTSIDRSIHRMIGTPPLPTPSTSQKSVQNNEVNSYSVIPKVASSQSTMAMSSLMPSASMEPISEWAGDGNRMTRHNRSISEPDFGRSPIQMDPSKEAASADRGNSSMSGGSSRFGLIGSQLLQKTMGWVSRSRPDRQAKLGETNKFYYDEKLKRWVEEGVEPPAQEAALPPPPTTASFQNGMSDHNVNSAFQSQSSPANGGSETKSLILADHHSSGIPPIPPSTNQFSARSRTGVRSRYVDTFNKSGGTPTNLFKSPFVPAAKAGGGAKFFVPTPTATGEQKVDATEEGIPEVTINEDHPSTLSTKDSPFSSPSSSSSSLQTIHRFPSMNNIALVENKGMGALQNGNGSRPYHSRAASWSPDMYNRNEIKTLGETLGMMPPSSFMPSDHSSMRPNSNGGSFGDLHEVEL